MTSEFWAPCRNKEDETYGGSATLSTEYFCLEYRCWRAELTAVNYLLRFGSAPLSCETSRARG